MPAVQSQFDKFHDEIKLDLDNEKAKLREKRETLLAALKDKLPADVPSFERFNQGSYSMDTGVFPLNGNYDIDVGVVFDCDRTKFPDPVTLKKRVRDALNSNGRTVSIRRSCVTVDYMRDGKPEYHVDLALYVKRSDGLFDLAKGKEHSEAALRKWEPSDPKGLTSLICSAFDDAKDLAQYRRCIRYIKRWRDVNFSSGAPLSIALTVSAKNWFKPSKTTNGTYTDIVALAQWVKTILNNFSPAWTEEGGLHDRLKVVLPVSPGVDLMGGMTRSQMESFQSKLKSLSAALDEAYEEPLPEEACKLLAKHFGDLFPVPEKSSTARSVAPAVIGTGNSA